MTRPMCPYCNAPAVLVTGREIYPHRPDLYAKHFYRCAPCDAVVGCHPGTKHPLGRLANAELRQAKMAAHAAFDPLWKQGRMTRRQAYAWLAERLALPDRECHIGWFDPARCARVVAVCTSFQATLTDRNLKVQVRRLMHQAILDDADLNATGLAELTAEALGHDDWLDDEGHWIWEVAVEVFEWAGKLTSESEQVAEKIKR